MKTYGGFFKTVELPQDDLFHFPEKALPMHSGRASLVRILQTIGAKRVWIPDYSCPVILKTIQGIGLEAKIYPINNRFSFKISWDFKSTDCVLYLTYFLNNTAGGFDVGDALSDNFGEQVIIDNTHDYFHAGYKHSYSFNSCRKWFGVPDGSLLYYPAEKEPPKIGE